jgi:histidine decarboxylase
MDYKSLSKNVSLGYPSNSEYDYSELSDFYKYKIINVGDPWSSSTYKLNTKILEREVLQFFADLWGIEDYWGYISSGSTESNTQGLYVARELHPNAIFYTSHDSHYSIFKIARLLKLNLCEIKSQDNGEINYNDFEEKLIQNKSLPVIINLNLGTTMKSAFDDPLEIYRILKKHNKHNDYYAHADGALMGFVLPFIQEDILFKSHIHSICISGHKFLGIPFPCGIFLMEKKLMLLIQNNIEIIGSNDGTISGCRNGHASIFFKYIIDKKGFKGFKDDIKQCFINAQYLVKKLNEIHEKAEAWRNQNSITVIFTKPSKELIEKYQLAPQGDICHIIALPHATRELLDLFLEDYKSEMVKKFKKIPVE